MSENENNNNENSPIEPSNPNIELGMVDGKMVVILPSGGVQIIETATSVFTTIAPNHKLFVRGGRVVELVNKDDVLELDILTPEASRTRFEEHCHFFTWRKRNGGNVLKPSTMPMDIARSLLASKEARESLPNINGLINCPIIRADGEKLKVLGQGYDSYSGILVTKGNLPPDIELAEAVKSLNDLLEDYNFQTPSDKSRAIAAFITPALKFGGLLKGDIPFEVAEADESFSGKTYRLQTVAAIYGEVPAYVTKKTGGVGSVDETFAQQLVKGHPFILFDNFRGKLDSQYMEAFKTAGSSFPARVPHKGTIDIDPSQFIVMLSSNGVDTTRDFSNRSSIVRIKKVKGYKFRSYEEGDLLNHVKVNQAYYLGCVFTVIKFWFKNGMPRTDERRHGFIEWAQILDWIVQEIFNQAPLLDGHESAQERVSSPGLNFLRDVGNKIENTPNFNKELATSEIFNICQEEAIEIPGLSEFKQDDPKAGGKRIGSILRPVFRNKDRVEVEGFEITKSVKNILREAGKGYRKIPAYIFSKGEEREAPRILLPGSP